MFKSYVDVIIMTCKSVQVYNSIDITGGVVFCVRCNWFWRVFDCEMVYMHTPRTEVS